MAKRRDDGMLRPNELSVRLVPNRLSVLEGQRVGETAPFGEARPARREARMSGQDSRPTAYGRRRSGPRVSIPGLLIAGLFLVTIASRISNLAQPPPGDGQRAVDGVPAKATAGEVLFGHGQGLDCAVIGRSSDFAVGEEIWWTATFAKPRDAGAQVRWHMTRAGVLLFERVGPTEPPATTWDTLCGDEPLDLDATGAYRFEVRELVGDTVLASGAFTLR